MPMLRTAAILAAAICAIAPLASAFEVKPFSFELTPAGRGASQVVRVTNAGREPVAIEVEVKSRVVEPDGADRLSDAGGDLAVFPPQAIAPPGGAASFRVRYTGPKALDASRDYVVLFHQTPLGSAGPGQSGVKVIMTFGAAVHVTPPGARPDVRFVSARKLDATTLEITLENAGKKYARIGDAAWTLSCGDAAVRLERDQVRALAPSPLILPGAKRVVRTTIDARCRDASAVSVNLAAG